MLEKWGAMRIDVEVKHGQPVLELVHVSLMHVPMMITEQPMMLLVLLDELLLDAVRNVVQGIILILMVLLLDHESEMILLAAKF